MTNDFAARPRRLPPDYGLSTTRAPWTSAQVPRSPYAPHNVARFLLPAHNTRKTLTRFMSSLQREGLPPRCMYLPIFRLSLTNNSVFFRRKILAASRPIPAFAVPIILSPLMPLVGGTQSDPQSDVPIAVFSPRTLMTLTTWQRCHLFPLRHYLRREGESLPTFFLFICDDFPFVAGESPRLRPLSDEQGAEQYSTPCHGVRAHAHYVRNAIRSVVVGFTPPARDRPFLLFPFVLVDNRRIRSDPAAARESNLNVCIILFLSVPIY